MATDRKKVRGATKVVDNISREMKKFCDDCGKVCIGGGGTASGISMHAWC